MRVSKGSKPNFIDKTIGSEIDPGETSIGTTGSQIIVHPMEEGIMSYFTRIEADIQNLIPSNIASGVNILGVVGDMQGGGSDPDNIRLYRWITSKTGSLEYSLDAIAAESGIKAINAMAFRVTRAGKMDRLMVSLDKGVTGEVVIASANGNFTFNATSRTITVTTTDTSLACYVYGAEAITDWGTASAGQVLAGYTLRNSTGALVNGTMIDRRSTVVVPNAATSIGDGKLEVSTIPGFYDSSAKIQPYDANYDASNIKQGTSIFGLTGTLDPGYKVYYAPQLTSNSHTLISSTTSERVYKVQFTIPSDIGTISGYSWTGLLGTSNIQIYRTASAINYFAIQHASKNPVNGAVNDSRLDITNVQGFISFTVSYITRINPTTIELNMIFSANSPNQNLSFQDSTTSKWSGNLTLIHK